MNTTQKCPMCAEEIPLEAATCKYCGAKFAVTITGYCTNCHELREADAKGHCKVCGTEVADVHVESKFIEEAAPQPVTLPPAKPAPVPAAWPARKSTAAGSKIAVGVLSFVILLGVIGVGVWSQREPVPAVTATPDVIEAESLHTLSDPLGRYVNIFAWSVDGTRLASYSGYSRIQLWDVQNGTELRTLTGGSGIDSMAWSPDGTMLAAGVSYGDLGLWNTASGEVQIFDLINTGTLDSVAWSPDGQIIAAGTRAKTVILWDVQNGTVLRTLTRHADYVKCVLWSPDGTMLASASEDGMIMLWDSTSGELLHTLAGIEVSRIGFELAWSPDGTTLAAGSIHSITLWDVASGALLHVLNGLTVVDSIAWSPDGSILITFDSRITQWDPSSGDRLRATKGYMGSSSSAFSPDGSMLATGDYSGTLTLWRVSR